ncbi:MAG: glycosyltransferase family 2 protein [Cyanobacteria bacterium]|nr:glycosyltransferase family 2 protein [Cyanobacteriota bacterium]
MITLSIYMVSTFLILGLFGLTCAFYHFMKPVDKSKLDNKELPLVSVLVPARNEETKIGRCIESLLAQDYPNVEIIIIDDRSTDSTGDIIASYARKDSRIKFVQGKDAPPGWIGKCNALAHAVGYASGEWYVFTDADTYHHPNSVRDGVSFGIENKNDLLSFIPMQELGSFPEQLIMPLLLSSFLLGDPFHTVNDPGAKRAYAYGQYIICRASSYHAAGGHQSVRDEIVEDHAIARVFKEKGYRVAVADGKTLYSVRMYTDLKSLWQGWTKNLYSLIDSKVGNLLLILLMMNATVLCPYFELAWVISEWFQGEITTNLLRITALSLAQYVLLFVWYKTTGEHHKGVNSKHFFLLPFGAVTITVLYLHAAYLVLFGEQVNWKGRKYVVNTRKTIQSDGSALEQAKLMADASDV